MHRPHDDVVRPQPAQPVSHHRTTLCRALDSTSPALPRRRGRNDSDVRSLTGRRRPGSRTARRTGRPGHELVVRADLDDPRAVEHDDEVGHPHRREPVRDEDGDPPVRACRGTPAAKRSKSACSVSASSAAVGSSSTSSSGSSRMNPRASASFCHWPTDTSTPSSQVGPSWVSSPAGSRSMTSSAPARSTAALDRGAVVDARQVAEADAAPAGSSKRKKSWKAPASRSRHIGSGMRARSTPSTVMRPAVGVVEPASSFTRVRLAGAVLADERDDRAGRERRGSRRRAPGGRCPGRRTTRGRAGCRR